MLSNLRVLLIISGGIAAYKSLELIRSLKAEGAHVRPILTKAGREFVTPLSVSSLAREKVHEDLFSLTDESEIGHIRLARETDLVVVGVQPEKVKLSVRKAKKGSRDENRLAR